jgi:hypothetical protein
MVEFNIRYTDSNYRFTNPIRFFKANDPFYYEVENIPLKQLQENDLWLKDQLTKIQIDGGITRENFDELRPYTEGTDNTIKVKPGRFSARINDAYNLTVLQVITNILGNTPEFNVWLAGGAIAPGIVDIIDRFKTTVQLDLNGLAERTFTWPAAAPRLGSNLISNSQPVLEFIPGPDGLYGQPQYPGVGAILWNSIDTPALINGVPPLLGTESFQESVRKSYVIRQQDDGTTEIGFSRLGAAETAFIKRWRGVARTAIVDVPGELSIEVPEFNPEDYFYIDASGTRVPLDANQRIDLLFIYSKPIDVSSTTVQKFVNNNPTTITKAELGLVHGAGLGVNFKSFGPIRIQEVLTPFGSEKGQYLDADYSTLEDGSIKMLAHPGDASGVNTGFNISGISIKGSFPSPDDLMNVNPLLDTTLNVSSYALIGQTVLPIAYIVVKKSASKNSNNINIITAGDVIDIRPFFRTTELTYNERAGLAAAIPAPSLANPVVTQAELGYEINRVLNRIPPPTQPSDNDGRFPRVVHSNTIQGGWAFGAEGALLSYVMQKFPNLTRDQAIEKVAQDYALPRVEPYPDWDDATWCRGLSFNGQMPNDKINYHAFKINSLGPKDSSNLPRYKYSAYSNRQLDQQLKRFGTNPIINDNDAFRSFISAYPFNTDGQATIDGLVNLLFVRKKINLDRTRVPWMCDYNVNVQFMNCTPLTCATVGKGFGTGKYTEALAGIAGLWVEKYVDHFYIYAAWVANDYRNLREATPTGNTPVFPVIPRLNREGNYFAGFAVFSKDIVQEHHVHNPGTTPGGGSLQIAAAGEASVGVAIYPTVQFEVVGIPTTFAGRGGMSNGNIWQYNPTILLA